MTANAITKKQNKSDSLIPVVLTESVRSCESERTKTENDNNKQDGIPTRIHAIRHRRLQKNRKSVTESDSDKSERDEMSNTTDNDTEEKELSISNSSIKVHIPRSLVWLNLAALNSTK